MRRAEVLILILTLTKVWAVFNNSAFDYHIKIGVPKAIYVRQEESKKIVGGTQANLGDFAFQAGILITLTSGWPSICSGSLISQTRVLTAAHCWFDGVHQAALFTVVLGSVTLYSGGTRLETRDIVAHPSWNPEDVRFDVAIVRIDPVEFNNNIYSVLLPSLSDASEDFAGRTGTASGFGKLSDGTHITPLSASLYRVDLQIIGNAECGTIVDGIHGSHLCTSGEGGKGTCEGDSGGPLTVLWGNQRTLIGIASFDFVPLCERGYPSVFSRVTAFLPWILANV